MIGLIIITCFNGDMLGGSLMALLATAFHGYYTADALLGVWLGSTTAIQLVFCGALCLALKDECAGQDAADKQGVRMELRTRPAPGPG